MLSQKEMFVFQSTYETLNIFCYTNSVPIIQTGWSCDWNARYHSNYEKY